MEEGGQWWLPQSPGRTVPGVLRVDNSGRSQLTLIGELRNELTESERHDRADGLVEFRMTEDALHRSGRYPRVLGRIGNREYTLDGGVRTRRISACSAAWLAKQSCSIKYSAGYGLMTGKPPPSTAWP